MWKYTPLLNVMIQMLVTMGLGGVMGKLKIFKADEFSPLAVLFIFFVALPCLVIKSIGINLDFYDYDRDIWAYIVAFLILRAIALAASLLMTLGSNFRQRQCKYGLGDVAVIWLCLTWISTVIMGVPIASAIFGDPSLGQVFGVLAGVSSFIFQLPLQLAFFEAHALDQDRRKGNGTNPTIQEGRNKDALASETELASGEAQHVNTNGHDNEDMTLSVMELAGEPKPSTEPQVKEEWWQLTGGNYMKGRDVWIGILKRVSTNPVLWGIFIGFVLSLSTLGPTYLNPKSPDFVEGLGWVDLVLSWLGDIVSPLSLFVMGIWMQAQGLHRLVFAVPPCKIGLYMLSKLILVPMVMVGLAKAMALNDTAGRVAILIASLPISLVSFSLGHRYSIGEAVLSANIGVGVILMLPTVIVWNIVMDRLNLFPIE